MGGGVVVAELKTLLSERGSPIRYYVLESDNPEAETLLILHGFPQDLETWMPIARSLNADHRVIVAEQRGYSHATSTLRWWDYRLSALRLDAYQILLEEAPSGAHILSHDWGGSVAWSLVRWRPELVRSLTVISMPEPRALAASFLGKQLLKSWYVPLLQLPFVPEMMTKLWGGRSSTLLLHRMGLSLDIARRYTADRAH